MRPALVSENLGVTFGGAAVGSRLAMKRILLSSILGLSVGFLTGCGPQPGAPGSAPAASTKTTNETTKLSTNKPAAVPAASTNAPAPAAAANEVAVIKTSFGEMVVEFWPEVAPKTVENFKTLAKKGFYDGTCFHRVIKGFMIQGGDPLTKDASAENRWGTGDPGYKIKAEFNERPHVRGVLSMARSASPDSAGVAVFCLPGRRVVPGPAVHGLWQADQGR